jgi:hypothetical protein
MKADVLYQHEAGLPPKGSLSNNFIEKLSYDRDGQTDVERVL